ncbi:MAG TPA: hypothetical protein VKM55_09050 [Candidatus Lokiarchaeia archaeon]|nr:hypothetical protein [Candidatus Lokiarchaeia archaeon]
MEKILFKFPYGTTYYIRLLAITCGICGGTWCFGLAGMMWANPAIFTIEPWYELGLGVLFCAGCTYAYLLSDHRVSVLILAPIGIVLVAYAIYNPYIEKSRAFGAWEFFAVVQTIYGLVTLAGAGFLIAHVIIISIRRNHASRSTYGMYGRDMAIQHLQKFKALHVGLVAAMIGGAVLAAGFANNWFIPQDATVTLQPKNYITRFEFYGPAGFYTDYTNADRADLNALGVRIVTGVTNFISYQQYIADPYTWWLNLTSFKQTAEYESARAIIINTFTPWKLFDSNVTFLYSLEGIPGGFPTEYAVTDGNNGVGAMLLNAWLAAQVIVEANLTNVVGFSTDQEGVTSTELPFGGPANQSFQDVHNFDRSEQATDNYLAFIKLLQTQETTNSTWITFDAAMNKIHGVDHFLLTTTYSGVSYEVGVGGAARIRDMEVLTEDVVNTVPFDQFMPMLYDQNSFPPDLAQYTLYTQLRELNLTLSLDGYSNLSTRIGVILGILGDAHSMFMPNYTAPMWTGTQEETVSGLAIVARQCMIAKCFDCPWITFFLYELVNNTSMLGINHTFGESFFDRLNVTINSPNDTAAFTIRFYPQAGANIDDYSQIVFMSDGWAWYYSIGLVMAVLVPWYHHVVHKRHSGASTR